MSGWVRTIRRASARWTVASTARGRTIIPGTTLLIAVVLGGAASAQASSSFQPRGPAIAVAPMAGSQGSVVMVRLDGWPAGVVVVETCGNDAADPTTDCNLAGSRTVNIDTSGVGQVPLDSDPPTPCPCVVRVATQAGDVERTLPITLDGGSTTPTPPPSGAPRAIDLVVSARITEPERSWVDSWLVALGASGPQVLEVTLENRGPVPMDALEASTTVGRGEGSGQPRSLPSVGVLAAGGSRVLVVPLDLPAPAVGAYEVAGRVRGLDEPVVFTARTADRAVPVPALVVGAVVLAGSAVGFRRRSRRTRPGDERVEGEPGRGGLRDEVARARTFGGR